MRKTVKLLSALALCLFAMSASAANGSGVQSDVPHIQLIGTNVGAQGGFELAGYSPYHGKHNTKRKHRPRHHHKSHRHPYHR